MIIDGREYAVGVHEINGSLVQVVDEHTCVTVGKAPERPAAAPVEPEQPSALIDVNSATAEALQSLDGVGKAASRRIVASRPFETVDDLVRVKGITQKTVDANREAITV